MTGCQAELCASNVALPEHVRAGRTCSGKATLRTGRLAGWDTQHTSMSPPLPWRLGSCSASHTAVMVQAPARGLSTGLLLTHDAWHPHWTTLGPTPVKNDQEFARHRSAMGCASRERGERHRSVRRERKPRIFHTVFDRDRPRGRPALWPFRGVGATPDRGTSPAYVKFSAVTPIVLFQSFCILTSCGEFPTAPS